MSGWAPRAVAALSSVARLLQLSNVRVAQSVNHLVASEQLRVSGFVITSRKRASAAAATVAWRYML